MKKNQIVIASKGIGKIINRLPGGLILIRNRNGQTAWFKNGKMLATVSYQQIKK